MNREVWRIYDSMTNIAGNVFLRNFYQRKKIAKHLIFGLSWTKKTVRTRADRRVFRTMHILSHNCSHAYMLMPPVFFELHCMKSSWRRGYYVPVNSKTKGSCYTLYISQSCLPSFADFPSKCLIIHYRQQRFLRKTKEKRKFCNFVSTCQVLNQFFWYHRLHRSISRRLFFSFSRNIVNQ